jgi:ubiquinone/menaquinone biosynthesis C-methylase UbiE
MLDTLRKLLFAPNKKIESLPPLHLQNHIGGGDFEQIGNLYLDYFKTIGKLKSNDTVLDVGCGTGRMAIPLTKYLDKNTRYEGFDVSKECVLWCKDNISSRYQNFNFQHADTFNTVYNPDGKIQSENFIFPYDSNSFDFIFLISIFTHMLPKDVDHYFSEISRTLKKGGRCFITYFIIDQESAKCIRENKSSMNFFQIGDGIYSTSKDMPEQATAYDEDFIRQLYAKNGLTVNEPVYYGSWCARKNAVSGQDVIIAAK